jgi:hypothetical protein
MPVTSVGIPIRRYAGETEIQDLGSWSRFVTAASTSDAWPSIVVLPADIATELKAKSEIVANGADVFISARSSGAEQRRCQTE